VSKGVAGADPRYSSAACADLPGVELTPGLLCIVGGTRNGFTAVISHPLAAQACRWNGTPAGGGEPMRCS
jgi:hypothetical protein